MEQLQQKTSHLKKNEEKQEAPERSPGGLDFG